VTCEQPADDGGHPSVIVEERERFEREYGCTEREWLNWMPGATAGRPLEQAPGHPGLSVAIGGGRLRLQWQVLPPRVIALVRIPRLTVSFIFEGVSLPERREFLRRFDLFLQRGGG
jgi:hypothetical protein